LINKLQKTPEKAFSGVFFYFSDLVSLQVYQIGESVREGWESI